ncbi:LysR family transcriptional regulator [Hyphomicrobiales bacterium]|nr:LysR family transcriptional regulator [Hyphomicrobiales bacterium]
MIFQNGFDVMIKVARNKSFTKAASELGVSGAAVSKQIKILEDRLQLVLFNRTTRVVTLTEAGEQLFETLNRSEEEVSSVLRKIVDGIERPTGRLKINAPMAFGERFLVDVIIDYAKKYPEVILDIDFDDKKINIIEEGYDLVIRIGKLDDSRLIAKRLCDFSATVCASPSYIEKYGYPSIPENLKNIPAIIYKNTTSALTLNYSHKKTKKEGTVNLSPAIYTNTVEVLLNSTLKGIGFCRIPDVFCDQFIKEGKLVKLLPDYSFVPERGIYAIYPDRRYLPMKVRLFIDDLSKNLRA